MARGAGTLPARCLKSPGAHPQLRRLREPPLNGRVSRRRGRLPGRARQRDVLCLGLRRPGAERRHPARRGAHPGALLQLRRERQSADRGRLRGPRRRLPAGDGMSPPMAQRRQHPGLGRASAGRENRAHLLERVDPRSGQDVDRCTRQRLPPGMVRQRHAADGQPIRTGR